MAMSSGKGAAAGKKSLLIKYLRAPLWVLVRVRDLCVKSMIGGGSNVVYGNAMGCPTPQIRRIPRSFSAVNSPSPSPSPSDYRGAGIHGKAGSVDQFRRSKSALPLGGGEKVVAGPLRYTVAGFERIDEGDAGLEFDCEADQEKAGLLGRAGK